MQGPLDEAELLTSIVNDALGGLWTLMANAGMDAGVQGFTSLLMCIERAADQAHSAVEAAIAESTVRKAERVAA